MEGQESLFTGGTPDNGQYNYEYWFNREVAGRTDKVDRHEYMKDLEPYLEKRKIDLRTFGLEVLDNWRKDVYEHDDQIPGPTYLGIMYSCLNTVIRDQEIPDSVIAFYLAQLTKELEDHWKTTVEYDILSDE